MTESITPKPEENKNTVMKNEFEYKAELLSALFNSLQGEEVSIPASMVKDTEDYRKGILEALGMEYTDDDVKHTPVFRSKVIDGVKNMSGGGGGDFSTAEVTVIMEGDGDYDKITAPLIDGNQATGFGEPRDDTTVFTVILYKGTAIAEINTLGGHLSVSGNITITDRVLKITGDGTITIS